jgi:hypothetical protein
VEVQIVRRMTRRREEKLKRAVYNLLAMEMRWGAGRRGRTMVGGCVGGRCNVVYVE